MSAKFDFSRLDRPFEASWPVSVPIPQDDGKIITETFTARFRQLTGAEIDAAVAAPGFDTVKGLPRLVFQGLEPGDGVPDFTPELKEQLLDRPNIREAIMTAYREFTVGAAAKN